MADWRLPLLRAWQARRDRRARTTVLVLGDSHVRVFEHWWFLWALPRVHWHIVYVPGGTATGLANAGSITSTRTRFDQALAEVAHDWVIVNLGEVDTGYTIWARAARGNVDPQALMQQAVERYVAFLECIAPRERLIVLGAPLPTLPDRFEVGDEVSAMRRSVPQPQVERTRLTLEFNARVAAACRALGIRHLDDRAASLGPDGCVRRAWQHPERPDHHYARPVYARWLARSLKPWLRT